MIVLVCSHMITHLVVYIRYAMDTRGLPDIYIFNPQPRALGVYIRQTIRAHGTTIMYIRTHVATGKHTQHTQHTHYTCIENTY